MSSLVDRTSVSIIAWTVSMVLRWARPVPSAASSRSDASLGRLERSERYPIRIKTYLADLNRFRTLDVVTPLIMGLIHRELLPVSLYKRSWKAFPRLGTTVRGPSVRHRTSSASTAARWGYSRTHTGRVRENRLSLIICHLLSSFVLYHDVWYIVNSMIHVLYKHSLSHPLGLELSSQIHMCDKSR